MRIGLVIVLWISSFNLNAQVKVEFQLCYKEQLVHLNDTIINPLTQDEWVLNTFKFYVSDFEILNEKQESISSDLTRFHLVDFENTQSTSWNLKDKQNNREVIRFGFGIDSLTNVSGAFGGGLDPVNGMYWTWQSGYINCKIEGYSSKSGAKDHSFEYHLGGYSGKQNAFRTILLPVKTADSLVVQLDLEHFLNSTNFQEVHHIMSPSQSSLNFVELLSKSFKL
ncbi:MbnP family protein [Fluviicola taffensis]|uniref:Copper-binding protein MbnP-like domain-containing protein n=1 Tax=Fluviicola taffensis (strain DSM 16823 / NCIMB 13979 / RW262) TaxID=755732 RepID=F2IHM1_FLUTR|nr:MbnP family protein [Fluviicola taffensis]AEA44799.1 hypothetical protein Fluta_2819 [Fluviicola taffensis DSM 16823]